MHIYIHLETSPVCIDYVSSEGRDSFANYFISTFNNQRLENFQSISQYWWDHDLFHKYHLRALVGIP